MATRVRTAGRFANLVGSDSEPDLGGIDSSAAYPRKRQVSVARSTTSNRVVKPVSKMAGSIDSKAPRRKSPRRQALTDKSNLNATRSSHNNEKPRLPHFVDDDETADEDGVLELQKPKDMRKKQRLEDSRPIKQSAVNKSKRYASSSPRHETRQLQNPSVPKYENYHAMGMVSEDEAAMDMVDVVGQEEEDDEDEDEKEEQEEIYDRPQAVVPIVPQTRPVSRSQNSDGDNSLLQRQLREMTRKYENLEGRYTELREVGVKSAERNYEKLRKQADENTANANKLIAKLKEELATQRQARGDTESRLQRLQDSESKADDLSNKVTLLTGSLAEAERQIQALNIKLAASRAAPGGAVSGSAAKGNAAKAWTGQSELVHAAHAKEDLYADLTGLLIQGMKKEGNEDIFDCLQTGRNGTLHFKLGLTSSSTTSEYKTSSVNYAPQLQPGRDSDLIEHLPEYLCEEIRFDRPLVANFYAKVVRALKG